MKKFLFHIGLFLVPAFAGMVLLFHVKVDNGFSYRFVKGECSNKASWIYERIFLSEENIDVVFMGASQTGSAVVELEIEKELAALTGKEYSVVNLAYCRGGRDIQYVMLNELFRHKRPSLVVIEVTEDEPKKSHPVFPYLAETHDLFGSFGFFNFRFLVSVWKGLTVRLEYLRWKVFDGQAPDVSFVSKHGFMPSDEVADPSEIQRNLQNWEKRLQRKKPEWIHHLEIQYSKKYVEKMIDLIRESNEAFLFLYLRESGSGLKLPLAYDYYLERSDVILLPDSIFTHPENWKDATHFNNAGAKLSSRQIAAEIAGMMDD